MRRSPMPTWQVFGTTLKSLRTSRQWGLRPFARMVRIDPGYLCLVEAGKTAPPSNEFLCRMAERLEIPAQTLLISAGRLPPETMLAFWQHPAIPPILSTIPGMSLDDAQTFCRQVLATLPQPVTV
jgi:transcriptional regulator with XRE-family HTH domain